MAKKNLIFSNIVHYNNTGQILLTKCFMTKKTIFYYFYILKGL